MFINKIKKNPLIGAIRRREIDVSIKKRLLNEEKRRLKVNPTRISAKISEIQLMESTKEEIWIEVIGKKENSALKETGWKVNLRKKPIIMDNVGGNKITFLSKAVVLREECAVEESP